MIRQFKSKKLRFENLIEFRSCSPERLRKASAITLDPLEIERILSGRQTLLRRPFIPRRWTVSGTSIELARPNSRTTRYDRESGLWQDEDMTWSEACPFGVEGDLLWVRENYALSPEGEPIFQVDSGNLDVDWRPASRMPLHLSRIMLWIEGVRMQDVRYPEAQDLWAEGFQQMDQAQALASYQEGWIERHGRESWQQGRLCWVLTVRAERGSILDLDCWERPAWLDWDASRTPFALDPLPSPGDRQA